MSSQTSPARPEGGKPGRVMGAPSALPYDVLFGPPPERPWMDRVAVVLVRPGGAANLGMIARAMKNFGLTRLRVAGDARFNAPEARDHACHAVDVLDRAETFPDLRAAVADRALVIGTSVPRAGLADRHEMDTPRSAAPRIRAAAEAGNGVALVFGPENHGLDNDELALSHRVVTVPAHPDYAILNLAQCVLLVAYELFMADAPGFPPPRWADRGELDRLDADLQRTLIDIGFTSPERVHRALKPLRRLFSRAGMTPRDVRLVHGLLRRMRQAAGGAGRGT